jgi:hypothetical protein
MFVEKEEPETEERERAPSGRDALAKPVETEAKDLVERRPLPAH